MRRAFFLLLLLLPVLFSYLALQFLPASWTWILLAWAFVAWILFRSAERKTTPRVVWSNIASILSILCVFEAGVTILDLPKKQAKEQATSPICNERLYDKVQHDILGSVPPKGTTRHARKFYNDRLLYDAVYTIADNGLRITPPCQNEGTQAVLFFGGSYAFGEGLNDDQTMPYLTGIETQGKYCVYNFAVHGYGTHQMLAAIEHGMVDAVVEQESRYAIYPVLYPSHVYRLAGLRSWNRHGPKYLLQKDGRPQYAGHFDDGDLKNPDILTMLSYFKKSALVKRFLNWTRPLNDEDKKLFAAMIIESRQLLRARSSQIAFHVIAWGDQSMGSDKKFFDDLREAGITVHHIPDILPHYSEQRMPYVLDEKDEHPNALAHRLIAQYVTEQIIRE